MDRQTPSPAPATRSSTARTARRSCCWILTAVECRRTLPTASDQISGAVLMEVVPDLRHAARLIRASTSAGLFNFDTGDSLDGSGGLHGYVIARDGADAERFLTALHDRCWLHGLGWIKLGAAGQMLDRSIIDRSVAAPERLVFEATPILSKPLGQDQESRRPIVHDGGNASDPASASSSWRMAANRLDLPQPFAPTSPTLCPVWIVRLAPSSRRLAPRASVRLVMRSKGQRSSKS